MKKACKVIPGGVDSPVRAFKSVGGTPPFIQKGEGAYLYDIDGNKYHFNSICFWQKSLKRISLFAVKGFYIFINFLNASTTAGSNSVPECSVIYLYAV